MDSEFIESYKNIIPLILVSIFWTLSITTVFFQNHYKKAIW
jgi:hypothetical protein